MRRIDDKVLNDIAFDYVQARIYKTDAQIEPTALIIAGQPGSGKSTVATELEETLVLNGGFIRVSADEVRDYLPNYSPNMPSKETQADAGRLAQLVQDHALKAKRNVIIEGTLRDPTVAVDLVSTLNKAGYKSELHAMAVNEQTSFVRAVQRFENAIPSGQKAREIYAEHHSQSFSAIPQSLQAIEKQGLVSRVAIYNRLGDPVHDATPTQSATASDKLTESRSQLTDFERIALAKAWDQIIEQRSSRGQSLNSDESLASERAHYTLHSSNKNHGSAPAKQYEYDYPDMRFDSKEKADSYGGKLQTAFLEKDYQAANRLPELKSAFVAQAAIARFAQERSLPAAFVRDMNDRIGKALANAEPIKSLQIKEGQELDQKTDRSLQH
jgi:predicted ABC-type ATPase